MKARIIKTGNLFKVQVETGFWIFKEWEDKQGGFDTLEKAEKWISENLFSIDFEVVAEYVDNTKKIHV